ncbi:hypothetical protein BV898_14886 [Hypsibius exemplaris]|uniref:CAS1 domain-containing protein 1 n=1 Tax=Hypsibius exemplaris TaxID=2072580 RepID=A0A9X6N9N0_HYPEX|nr:hypothetical protein BV898_14886 [Hypsibius exemplaris]
MNLFVSGSANWMKDATTVWKPDAGCDIRYRSLNESVECLRKLERASWDAPYIIFIGDSRLRQLRDGVITELTGDDYDFKANLEALIDPTNYKKHAASGTYFQSAGTHLWFEWYPYFGEGLTNLVRNLTRSPFKPTLVVMGVGIWLIRDCHRAKKSQEECVQKYQKDFESLYPFLEELSTTSTIIWVPQMAVRDRKFENENNINVGFNNKNMKLYNDAILKVLSSKETENGESTAVTYWHSAWQASIQIDDGFDGLHMGGTIKHHLTQMLIDWTCGLLLPNTHGYDIFNPFKWNSKYCCE